MTPELLDPRSLKTNPWNTNAVSPANLVKLRKSIEDLGFVTAVVVRTLADGSLQILGGQHRTEVAIDMGLKKVPVLNLGTIDDIKAKKIGLIDNSRYGTDDAIAYARLLEEIQVDTPDLTAFLPLQADDLQVIMRAIDINLDDLEVKPGGGDEEDEAPNEGRAERPIQTHDTLKFRVPVRDAEAIIALIEKTKKRESLSGSDDMTLAGEALAILLLGTKS
jgi:ParB-like chromosome segregation protein Spo0J